MRQLLVLSGGVLMLCAALIGGTRALARRDLPAHVQALLPDPSCPAPCWQGLRPGYSTTDDILNWIANPPDGWHVILPFTSKEIICQYGSACIILPDQVRFDLAAIGTGSTQAFFEVLPYELTLGDVLVALGEPDAIGFNLGASQNTVDFRLYYLDDYLIVNGQVSIKGTVISPDDPELSPTTQIAWLQYQAQPMSRPLLAFDWRGFGSLARYYPDGLAP
jgi:hypothetical protein